MAENILIRGVNWIGDAVMTMPALWAVRKAMPGDRISLLVNRQVAPLFEQDPSIDEILFYEDRHKSLTGKMKLAREIKGKDFSLALLLQNAFDAALISYLAGIPRRIGYARDMRGFLLTEPLPYSNEDRRMHHIDYYLELLKRAGIDADRSDPWLYLLLDERLHARELLSTLKRPIIGIHPGAAYGSAKQWLPGKFSEIADRITGELDGSVVIYGGNSETGITDEITSLFKGPTERFVSMSGKTTLREMVSLFSESDLIITNDSGPMHLAYAVKTPLVAIFGSTDPALTGPPEEGTIVIEKTVECRPCFLRKCRKKQIECMEAITTSEVFDSVKKLLPGQKAVFFDRDGTLCADADYLNNWGDFHELPALGDLKLLKNSGFKLVGVTNQSGIARGIVEENFVREINNYFIENHGFDDFYYCPHHPDEGCSCRKPSPQMLMRARDKHNVDLRKSYVIGDTDLDMLLARAAGAKGVLVRTGKQRESEYADLVATDMKQAIELILRS